MREVPSPWPVDPIVEWLLDEGRFLTDLGDHPIAGWDAPAAVFAPPE